MKPYYEHDGITIYHGDCREILPHIQADIVVTDPPYGIKNISRHESTINRTIANDDDTNVRDFILNWCGKRPAVVFGSRKAPRPPNVRSILIWAKGEHTGMGDWLFPWKPDYEEIYIFGKGFLGRRTSSVLHYNAPMPAASQGRFHLHEKPVSLLVELLSKCPPGVIIDPCIGSGSTLCAARHLRRSAIGIELEERYCDIAAQRLSQSVMDIE